MRKFLFIIYLLFLSCDSSEIFGVHELDNTTLDYYDYLSRGWQAVFDGDFDLAFSDFNEATKLDSIEYKNSAYVGLGWTATFYANSFFNSTDCLASNDIPCEDVVDALRLDAKNYFDLANIGILDAIDEYNGDNLSNGGLYINTFEEFDYDRQIGKIYLDLLEFDMQEFDLQIESDLLQLEQNIIQPLKQFLSTYNTLFIEIDEPKYVGYDIVNNKPEYSSNYNFNSDHLHALLSQLMLRIGNICEAHSYILDLDCDMNACSDPDIKTEQECLESDAQNTWDNTCNGDEQIVLQCLQNILQ